MSNITVHIEDESGQELCDAVTIRHDSGFKKIERNAERIAKGGKRCCIRWSRASDGQCAYWGPAGARLDAYWYG